MPNSDPQGSFIRWQSTTIAQLTYAINLILSFSVATLGFEITLLLNENFDPDSCWQKTTFLLSLLFLATSIAFGIWVVINRLCDFRMTSRAARLREKGKSDDEIEPYRICYRRLGKITWKLFLVQISSFGIGISLAILSVVPVAIDKLL